MERQEAVRKLGMLCGQDLVMLAPQYGIRIWKDHGKKNKGWAGHVLERYLGLPLNTAQAPNFGSWELKVVPVRHMPCGKFALKETMAITMIDPVHVAQTPFERSHLLAKLKKAVICARVFEAQSEPASILLRVATFDLGNAESYEQVKADYELVRRTIKTDGFNALTGAMGILVQPRTKGPGHGSTTRAFYARKNFVERMLGMREAG